MNIIGETENFLNRISDHKKNKEFDNIYVINSAILNKNICLELESKTIELFKNSISNYKVLNKNEINNSYLSYRDQLRFKDFWKIFKEIYFLLKFNLNPKNDLSFEKDENEVIFYYNEAKIKQVEGGYLALEGSKINMEEPKTYKSDKYFNNKIKKIRKILIEEKIINSEGKFLQNYFFRYPSWFSSLVSATSTSGYEKFKTKEQITLNTYLDRKINK